MYNASFVIKYNDKGTLVWVARASAVNPNDMVISDSGNVYIAGWRSSGNGRLYNSDGTLAQNVGYDGGGDAVIYKYDSTGFVSWHARTAGSFMDQFYGISLDNSENVYVSGYGQYSNKNVYNSNGTIFKTLTNTGGYFCFVVKYNSSGFAQWASKSIPIYDIFSICGVIKNDKSVFYNFGYGSQQTSYNSNDTSSGITIAGGGFCTSYYTDTGFVKNSSTIVSGTGDNRVTYACIDLYDNIYVCGIFSSSTLIIKNLDGSDSGKTLSRYGGFDTFLLKYNSNGILHWALNCGGVSDDFASRLKTDSSGNVYFNINYSNTININNSDGSIYKTFTSSGSDSLIIKYNRLGYVLSHIRLTGTGNESTNDVYCSTDSTGVSYIVGQTTSNVVSIYDTYGNVTTSNKMGSNQNVLYVKITEV